MHASNITLYLMAGGQSTLAPGRANQTRWLPTSLESSVGKGARWGHESGRGAAAGASLLGIALVWLPPARKHGEAILQRPLDALHPWPAGASVATRTFLRKLLDQRSTVVDQKRCGSRNNEPEA